MNMYRATTILSILALIVCGLQSQHIVLEVSNPQTVESAATPVVVDWALLSPNVQDASLTSLRLINDHGRSIPFQVDDLDADGTPDELSFIASCPPEATRTFTLLMNADSLPSPIGPLRTDAANYRRIRGVATPVADDDDPGSLRKESHYPFDGVGWESEVIGYRLYLDERNAVDIQAKRVPGLHWNFIGGSDVDYQLDAWWGMDVLHVGPSFGFGGIAIRDGQNTVKPERLSRRRTRVIARGPVRSVVRIEYHDWAVGSRTFDLHSMFLIYANDRITEHRISTPSPGRGLEIATGIVRHAASVVTLDKQKGYLVSSGKQARDGGFLSMIIAFPPEAVTGAYQTNVDDAVVLSVPTREPLRIFQSARWDGEPAGMIDQKVIDEDIGAVLRRMHSPLTVKVR